MLRRSFLIGLASTLTAPAIVHAGNLMPVKPIMVRGIRWCSHDWGLPTASGHHFGWHMQGYDTVVGAPRVPLSYFSDDIKKYSNLYPGFVWQIID